MYSWVKKKVLAEKDSSHDESDTDVDSDCELSIERQEEEDRDKVRDEEDGEPYSLNGLSFRLMNDGDQNTTNSEEEGCNVIHGEVDDDNEGEGDEAEIDSSCETESENDDEKCAQFGIHIDASGVSQKDRGLTSMLVQKKKELNTVSIGKDCKKKEKKNLPPDTDVMSSDDNEDEKILPCKHAQDPLVHSALEKEERNGLGSQASATSIKTDVPVKLTQALLIQEQNSVQECQSASQESVGVADGNLSTQENITPEDERYIRDYVGKKKRRNLARDIVENDACDPSLTRGHAVPLVTSSHSPPSESNCKLPSCLYNQTGRMCTVLGERFILAHINGGQQIVTTKLEESTVGPFGVALVWNGVQPKALKKVLDGEEVQFDAVLLPDAPKLIAVVVWQEIKPVYSIEPYFNSSVILEKFEGLTVKLASLDQERGTVSTLIHGKLQSAFFSFSDVYVREKQVSDVNRLSKYINSDAFFGNICVFVTTGIGSIVQYDYFCSCLWLGVAPQEVQSASDYDRFSLYRKSLDGYEFCREQVLMHCDASTYLVIKEGVCSLEYEEEDRVISIPCKSEFMYSGRKQVVPGVCGEVTAHVRKIINKEGKESWSAIMVQVPEKLITHPERDTLEHTKREAVVTTEPDTSLDVSNWKTHPQVFKNCHGTLHWNRVKLFCISANLNGKPTQVRVGRRGFLIVNGILTEVENKMVNIKVQFDVHLDRNSRYHVVAVWKGKKPTDAWNKSKTCKYHFDVPGVYQGMKDDHMEFDIILDGKMKSVRTKWIPGIYSEDKQLCTSISLLSRVSLHLKESFRTDSDTSWAALLIVVVGVPCSLDEAEGKVCLSRAFNALPSDPKHKPRKVVNCPLMPPTEPSKKTFQTASMTKCNSKSTPKQTKHLVFVPSKAKNTSQQCKSSVLAPSNVGTAMDAKTLLTSRLVATSTSQRANTAGISKASDNGAQSGIDRNISQRANTGCLSIASDNGAQSGISKMQEVKSQSAVKTNLNEISACSLGSSHTGHQTYLTFQNKSNEVRDKNINKTLIEDLQCQEIYLVLAGKINMSSMNYTFTYTQNGYSRSIPLPQDIAMDYPTSSVSLLMDFHLLVNKRDVCHPVCGWFEKRNRELLTKEFQVLHSYNPEEKFVTLLDQSGCLDHFLFDGQYLVMCNSRHLVNERSSRGQLVHAVLEEVESCNIEGHVVNKKVLLLTSNTYVYQSSLKFLSLSLTDNHCSLDSFITHQTSDVQLAAGEVSHSCTPSTPGSGCKDMIRPLALNGIHEVPVMELHNQLTSATTSDLMNISHTGKSSSLGMNKNSIRITESKNVAEDRRFLCRETLRKILANGYLDNLTKKHAQNYPVLLGQITGVSMFYCFLLSQTIPLPCGLPWYGWKKSSKNKKMSYLLTQKKMANGKVNFHPRFLWPEGAVCDPYIISARHAFLVDTQNRVLGLQDETTGSAKCYMYCYDVAYTQNGERTVGDFMKNLKSPLYAVVEDIPPKNGVGATIEGEILFLTSTYRMAVAGISTIVGNCTNHIG